MIHCSQCSYAWNPDTASNCVQCKAPLPARPETRRAETQNETPKSENSRRQTVAEGIASGVAPPPVPLTPSKASEPPEPETPQPRWSESKVREERAERRRTVFAGTPVAQDSPAANSSAYTSGQRRPATASVDPARRIVGVLITYSWHEQGQIFPVLEGRNLIGKDPDQCDISIPQDATLSAVNSFITFRRNFIIGDRVSMSGTDVDGEPIETEFVPLHNYAKIRTGSTHWTFVAIQPSTPDSGTGGS